MEKTNIALIGYGYWGPILEKYIPQFFNLLYVANSKFDRKIIWNDSKITSVIIATPIETHYEITKEALLHNKHVMCEKPFTLRIEEALELEEIAKERNFSILVDFVYTFSLGILKAKQIIEEGGLGRILSIELSLRKLGEFQEFNVYWLLASHLLAILDMFIPLRDLKFTKIDLVKFNDRVETGFLLFANSSLAGSMVTSLNWPVKEMKFIIYGEKGTLVYDPNEVIPLKNFSYKRITGVKKIDASEFSYIFDEGNNLKHALKSFAGMINGIKNSNIKRAIAVTKILESCKC